MKKNLLIYIIGLLIIGTSCNQTNLNETKWYLNISDDCGSFLYFRTDSVIIYECEIPEKIFGIYKVYNDTIEIQTIRGEFDNEFPIGSRHRHQPMNFRLYFNNDTIFWSNSNLIYMKNFKKTGHNKS